MRVVSLVPSLTETLIAWGIVPVACTRFCEQPAIAHVGGTKDPDLAAIVGLAPDLVLMDREENRRDDADALTAAGVEVLATDVTSVAGVAEMTAAVRARLGLEPPDEVGPSTDVPAWTTAFVPIWRRPWMTCSRQTYGSSLLASIGVENVYAGADTAYPTVELDDVASRAPALVLLPSEPYPFKQRHAAEIAVAIPDASIRFVDGQDLFWWGARTPAARERLAAALASGGQSAAGSMSS